MADKEGLASSFGHWMAVYAAYLFFAGWSYLKFYFHVFGVDTSWLEFGLNDTLAEGFSVLFGTGAYLSLIYVAVLLVSIAVEVFAEKPSRWITAGVPLALVVLFPMTFVVARNAGIAQANHDRGDSTLLPTVTFSLPPCNYRGKLVQLKGELFFVYRLNYLTAPSQGKTCPLDLADSSDQVPQVWMIRSGELKDVRITHYEREVRP